MFLLDTNVLLEVLLAQERAEEARELLQRTAHHPFYLTVFSHHSMGVALLRLGQAETFLRATRDLLQRGGVRLLALDVEDMSAVVEAAARFRLDFDDAYQYAAAERYALTLVSFDADFDRTERGRKTPAEVVEELA